MRLAKRWPTPTRRRHSTRWHRWEPGEAMAEDMRFKGHGVAPKSAADFAFLLHGLHYLKDNGVMAIILPHGVLFRGGAEGRIRRKLLEDGHIDTVIVSPLP